jgi:hypothetical protein
MPKKQELRIAELQCIANGHRFPAQVWHWVYYVADIDEPVAAEVMNTDGVRCPYPNCGSPADIAKG